jgi:hypothetical protein
MQTNMAKELPRALLTDNSALLAFSSNSGLESSSRPKCDEDVGRVASIMIDRGVVKSSSSTIITTTSEQCTKEGLQDVIEDKVSKIQPISDADGLFIFVYCGGACNLQLFDSSTKVTEPAAEADGDFVTVDYVPMRCKYSLLLKDFNSDRADTFATGEVIAKAISSNCPKQVLVVLDCPYAEEIGDDIKRFLNLNPRELTLMVSQGKSEHSCHLGPLESSTFCHFFCSFLPNCSSTGVIKLRPLQSRITACCEALSSLRMVRDGQVIRSGKTAPKVRFDRIIKVAENTMERIDKDDVSVEQVDYDGTLCVSQFLNLHYKKYLIDWRPAKLCNEAIEWVHGVMEGPLDVLHEHQQLNGKVLEAVVGSMMASIATIQGLVPQPNESAKLSNIFIQAYVYVVAAIDMLDHDLELFDTSLLECAQDFYCAVLRASKIEDREIQELKWEV